MCISRTRSSTSLSVSLFLTLALFNSLLRQNEKFKNERGEKIYQHTILLRARDLTIRCVVCCLSIDLEEVLKKTERHQQLLP